MNMFTLPTGSKILPVMMLGGAVFPIEIDPFVTKVPTILFAEDIMFDPISVHNTPNEFSEKEKKWARSGFCGVANNILFPEAEDTICLFYYAELDVA